MRSVLRNTAIVATLAAAVITAACGETTVAPPTANTRVFLSATRQGDVVPAGSAAQDAPRLNAAQYMGGINAESVDSIMVDILAFASIQSTDTLNYSATLPLNAATPTLRLNFRTLPVTGTDSIEIAKGRTPPGKYDAMRMRFSAATITFNTTVAAGGKEFTPGTYPLDMTHGITFAVDVPVDEFTITSGPKVTVVSVSFDVNSSISSIRLAGDSSGHLVMNPIFRASTR